jgi:hypothetical protein
MCHCIYRALNISVSANNFQTSEYIVKPLQQQHIGFIFTHNVLGGNWKLKGMLKTLHLCYRAAP